MSRVEVTVTGTHLKVFFLLVELFTLFVTFSHICNNESFKTRKNHYFEWTGTNIGSICLNSNQENSFDKLTSKYSLAWDITSRIKILQKMYLLEKRYKKIIIDLKISMMWSSQHWFCNFSREKFYLVFLHSLTH